MLKCNFFFTLKQDGKLPFVPLEEEFIMGVSKYGIKVSTSDQYVSNLIKGENGFYVLGSSDQESQHRAQAHPTPVPPHTHGWSIMHFQLRTPRQFRAAAS